MSCETMQERLSARLSGALDAAETQELEAHLASCADCAAESAELAALWREIGTVDEPVPSRRMRQRFASVLAAELAALGATGATGAAGAAGATGASEATGASAGSGGITAPRTQPDAELAARSSAVLFSRRSAPTSRASHGSERRLLAMAAMLLLGLGLGYLSFGRGGGDVAELKREVGDLHEMVAISLLERGSVSERLQGVAYGREMSAGDDRVVAALVARLIEDPNVNVRLAALEALRPVAKRQETRGELVAAVARQKSPLVALSLIDLLLESNDPATAKAGRHDLEQLLDNPKLDPTVRGYLRDRLGRSA